tara:strand:- start:79 stop:918 length:840 start_codon:yes stop_codon:yes gene_type:complete
MNIDAYKQAYERDGCFVVKSLFLPTEIQSMTEESMALVQSGLVARDNLRTEMWERDGQAVLSKFDPVADISETYAKAVYQDDTSSILSALFDEPAILFKDKLVYKIPGHKGFGPHHDHAYHMDYPEDMVAVAIALDPMRKENGCIEVVLGSHKFNLPVVNENGDFATEEIPEDAIWTPIELEAGDALFFSNLMLHRSAPNQTEDMRRALFLTYNRSSDGEHRMSYYNDHKNNVARNGYGESEGNFAVPEDLKNSAKFFPPVTRVVKPESKNELSPVISL